MPAAYTVTALLNRDAHSCVRSRFAIFRCRAAAHLLIWPTAHIRDVFAPRNVAHLSRHCVTAWTRSRAGHAIALAPSQRTRGYRAHARCRQNVRHRRAPRARRSARRCARTLSVLSRAPLAAHALPPPAAHTHALRAVVHCWFHCRTAPRRCGIAVPRTYTVALPEGRRRPPLPTITGLPAPAPAPRC